MRSLGSCYFMTPCRLNIFDTEPFQAWVQADGTVAMVKAE